MTVSEAMKLPPEILRRCDWRVLEIYKRSVRRLRTAEDGLRELELSYNRYHAKNHLNSMIPVQKAKIEKYARELRELVAQIREEVK
jgi:hypothetical protein